MKDTMIGVDCVYFIKAPINSLIKIGTTSNLTKRLRDLRFMSPAPLEPMGYHEGDHAEERELHVMFRHARSHGEWFRPTPDVLDYIHHHAKPWPPECDPAPRTRRRRQGELARLIREQDDEALERVMRRIERGEIKSWR